MPFSLVFHGLLPSRKQMLETDIECVRQLIQDQNVGAGDAVLPFRDSLRGHTAAPCQLLLGQTRLVPQGCDAAGKQFYVDQIKNLRSQTDTEVSQTVDEKRS